MTRLLLACLTAALLASCNGGRESRAAEEQLPQKNPITTATSPQVKPVVDVKQELTSISRAIPLYAGAAYRDDLTRRDTVMIKNQYGPGAEVYTLASDDSFPQIYHYYVTYLGQFRAWQPQAPYPPEQQNWRTLEVPLNQAMQDPFIPGDTLAPTGKQVILQIAETEAEPHTVIRYIVTPAPVQTASK